MQDSGAGSPHVSTPSTAARRRGRLSRTPGGPRQVPWLLIVPAGILTFLVHYAAVAAGGWYGFTDWDGVSAEANFIGLGNFREIFTDPTARAALEHTVTLAVAFVVAVNVIGLGLALALNRALKSRHFIRALFFMPVVVSPLATAYVWQFILGFNGPLNTFLRNIGLDGLAHDWLGTPGLALWAIWAVLVWQFAGLAMIMYLAGLQGIPEELDEAGRIDGASGWFRFRKVTLPLLAPATTIALTFFLIAGLRVFDQVIALTYGGPINSTQTLATEVYFVTFVSGRFGYGAAFALILTVLIVLVSFAQLAILRGRESRMM